MNPKLSILIPTTPDRAHYIEAMKKQFIFQLGGMIKVVDIDHEFQSWQWEDRAEVLLFTDNKQKSIGFKRNVLMQLAAGKYLEFVDSDDRLGDNHFANVFRGINKGVDCCSLTGIITEDGNNPLVFQHSIKYQEYKTNEWRKNPPIALQFSESVVYERYPNHLNCIKASIAKQFRFPEINHGEDTDFATQMFKAGVLKTEHWIEDVIYYYDYRSKK